MNYEYHNYTASYKVNHFRCIYYSIIMIFYLVYLSLVIYSCPLQILPPIMAKYWCTLQRSFDYYTKYAEGNCCTLILMLIQQISLLMHYLTMYTSSWYRYYNFYLQGSYLYFLNTYKLYPNAIAPIYIRSTDNVAYLG